MPRLSRRSIIAAATAVATAGSLATALSAPAAATSQASIAALRHTAGHAVGRRVYPTRATQSHSLHAAGYASGSGSLTYGGGVGGIGVTTGSPKVYLVFWGSQWGSQNGLLPTADPKGEGARLEQMYNGFGTGGELWSGVLTQYCQGIAAGSTVASCTASAAHVAYPSGAVLAGVWVDNSAFAPSRASEHALAVEAINAATHFGQTSSTATRNEQFIIASPTGAHPDGFNTFSGNFCAWHDYTGDNTLTGGAASSPWGSPVAFTNLPYIPDAGASCGAGYVNGPSGPLDGVTIVSGHEYAETLTDQQPAGGWTDAAGYEDADKCAWNGVGGAGGAQNVAFGNGSLAMQATYSDLDGACEIAHAIAGGGSGGGSGGGGGGGGNPPPANVVTVTSPGNQASTVGVGVSLQIHAGDSASGQTLSYGATGLPAGLGINSASGVISGTPTTAGNPAVTVTATDTTGAHGSATFTWTVNPAATSGCSSAGQKLVNPGFESGSVGWSATAGVITNSSGEAARTGSWKAWLDGYGRSHTDTLTQAVTLPSGCSSYLLGFWLHIDSAETTTATAYDRLALAINGTTVRSWSNLNKAAGYAFYTVDLSGYQGQTVTVGFTGTEDPSLQTSFVIDDTSLTVG